MATINDLMLRYKTQTAGAIRKFVTRHLARINADGIEHARQTPEGWYFDAEAVRILDELRGVSQIAVLEQTESERVEELQAEVDNLKTLLLASQNELIQTQKILQQKSEALNEAEKKFLVAESRSKDSQSELKLEQALHDVTKQQMNDYKQQSDKSNNRLEEMQQQLDRLKSRGLLDRIFNNF